MTKKLKDNVYFFTIAAAVILFLFAISSGGVPQVPRDVRHVLAHTDRACSSCHRSEREPAHPPLKDGCILCHKNGICHPL